MDISFYDNLMEYLPSEFNNLNYELDNYELGSTISSTICNWVIEEKKLTQVYNELESNEFDIWIKENNIDQIVFQLIDDYLNKYTDERIKLFSNGKTQEIFILAEIFGRFNKIDRMLFCYNLCINYKYKVGECYYKLGEYYEKNNDQDEMIKNYLLSIDNNYMESLYKICKFHMNNKNYKMVKKYAQIGIDKEDLESTLIMALYYRFIEVNIDEEIKYHLIILKNKILHEYDMFVDRHKYEENEGKSNLYIESLYFLSLCYKLKKNCSDKFKNILFQIVNIFEDYFPDCLGPIDLGEDVDSWWDFKWKFVCSKYFNYKLETDNNQEKYIHEYALKELINFFPKKHVEDEITYDFNYYMNAKLSSYFVLKRIQTSLNNV